MSIKFNTISFLLSLLILTGSCASQTSPLSPSPAKSENKKILVSIAPYTHIVETLLENVSKETVTILTLVPPQADMHIYDPTPAQLKELSDISLWIRIGEPSEEKVIEVAQEINPNIFILNLSQTTPLLDPSKAQDAHCSHHKHHDHSHAHACLDLHFWMSPKVLAEQIPFISSSLQTLLPEAKNELESACAQLMEQLFDLDKKLSKKLAPLEGKTLIISHPSLGYFCKEYHLTQISVEQEGKEPRPAEIEALLSLDPQKTIPLLLLDAKGPKKATHRIAEQMGWEVVAINPYRKEYFEILETLTQALLDAKQES